MRTTILLPDELYDRVRQTAAAERRTITSFIEQALQEALDQRRTTEDQPVFKMPVLELGGTLLPGVDINDNSAMLDLMDEL